MQTANGQTQSEPGSRGANVATDVLSYLAGRSRRFIIIAASVLALLIGATDYLFGARVGFSIFYLVPIALATWYGEKWSGMVVACVGAATWFASDMLAGVAGSVPSALLWNGMVRLSFFSIIVFLLNGFKREKSFAREDYLTGLGNRRSFFERADVEIQRSIRYGHHFSMAYIDIDDFKLVNDKFGHAEGDALLKQVGQAIAGHIRKTDIAARLGGDEFAVLIPESSNEAAKVFFSKLHAFLSGIARGKSWPVTFSIGVVTFNKPPESVDEMIMIVDQLMYSAKKSGKNLVKYEVHEKE